MAKKFGIASFAFEISEHVFMTNYERSFNRNTLLTHLNTTLSKLDKAQSTPSLLLTVALLLTFTFPLFSLPLLVFSPSLFLSPYPCAIVDSLKGATIVFAKRTHIDPKGRLVLDYIHEDSWSPFFETLNPGTSSLLSHLNVKALSIVSM